MMNPEPTIANQGPPPAPIRTKDSNIMPPPRPGNQRDSMRPDIQMARNESGIDLSDNFANPSAPERSMRPEMKGPSDISHLLSGLKKTTIGKSNGPDTSTKVANNDNNSSTISVSELKEMQAGGSVPKKSKRRPKSEKNTLSLDI